MLPGPEHARLQQAVALQQAGKLAEAEALYLEVLAAHPAATLVSITPDRLERPPRASRA